MSKMPRKDTMPDFRKPRQAFKLVKRHPVSMGQDHDGYLMLKSAQWHTNDGSVGKLDRSSTNKIV